MAYTKSEEQEQQLAEVDGFNSSIRLELLSSDTERRRLRECVGNQEREIQQVGRHRPIGGNLVQNGSP